MAALRFAPPLTNALAASQAVSSDGFVRVRVALFRVVNGRSFRSEITIGWTGICHPEWGYLAASRRSTWKLRLFIFAAAIGASATGAVCCSLGYRPVAEASVAERTLTPRGDRAVETEKATDMSEAKLRIDGCSPADSGRVEGAGGRRLPVALLAIARRQIVEIEPESTLHRLSGAPQTCGQH